MKLYHGSTVIVETPRIIKTEIGRDFGETVSYVLQGYYAPGRCSGKTQV
jgi:hypothetical protein